ncbi:MAG: HAD hydrolase-like protein [Methylacidiphilales bacterium]|nr:HAD hydrolase-like protein [Candidatus Methylacidiphilales bacterium]
MPRAKSDSSGRVRAIVFDAGGTLMYPADPIGETYAKFARSHGFKLAAEATTNAFREAMKAASPRTKGTVPRDGNDREWWKQIVKRSLPEQPPIDPTAFETFFEEVYLYFGKPEAWGIYPEVLEVFEELRDHDVDLAVLSNWDGRLHTVLDGNGLGEYLPNRFISAELGWEKPDPAIYRHVADVMRIQPASLLSVGDDARNDVEGPRRAGWQAVQIERPKKDLWGAVRAVTRR